MHIEGVDKTEVNNHGSNEVAGLLIGLLAIMCFSITLPATRLAVTYFDPMLVGLGRSIFIALPALLLLNWLNIPLPS